MKKRIRTMEDKSFVVVDCEGGYEVRFKNILMGISPIGPRLFKYGTPPIQKLAETKEEAEELAEKWTNAYKSEWDL